MQRLMSIFMILCLGLTLSLDANAKRMGAGKSAGAAPIHQTHAFSKSKGAALRPRKFCLVATSPSQLGPIKARMMMNTRKMAAASANLSARSIRNMR